MMMSEFIDRTSFEPTAKEYAKIEEAYYDFDGDKDAFCKAFVKDGGARKLCKARAAEIDRLNSLLLESERQYKKDSVEYMSEDVLLHHSRTLAIAYLALTEEAKARKASETYGRWLDGRCTVCGWEEPDEVGYDGCELEPWEHTGYCPNCGSKMKAE